MHSEKNNNRWFLGHALIHTWLNPVKATMKLAHTSLPKAWLFHMVMAVFTVATVTVLAIACTNFISVANGFWGTRGFSNDLQRLCGDIGSEFSKYPLECSIAIIASIAITESIFLGLALLVLPFAAERERFRDSFRHALRRTWLHTSAALPAALLICFLTIFAIDQHKCWKDRMYRDYKIAHPRPQNPGSSDTQSIKAYQKADSEYWTNRWRHVSKLTSPWYLAFAEELAGYAAVVISLWFLYTLFRGVTVNRNQNHVLHSLVCRECGYNLTGQPPDSRCPECGLPIAESISPLCITGSPWEHRRTIGVFKAYFQTAAECLRTPHHFSRKLVLTNPNKDALLFLLVSCAACFFIALAANIVSISMHSQFYYSKMRLFLSIPPLNAFSVAAVLFGFTCFVAVVVAFFLGLKEKRNILPGTAQTAAYCSVFLIPWMLIASLVNISIQRHSLDLRYVEYHLKLGRHSLEMFLSIAPSIIALIIYLILIIKASKGVRYAN